MNIVYFKNRLSTANVDKNELSTHQNSKMWINRAYGGGGSMWKTCVYRDKHPKNGHFSVDNFSTFKVVDKIKKLILCG